MTRPRRLFHGVLASVWLCSGCTITDGSPTNAAARSFSSDTLSTQAVKTAEDAAVKVNKPPKNLDLPAKAWQDVVTVASDGQASPSDTTAAPGAIAATGSTRTGPPTPDSRMASGRLTITDVIEVTTGLSVAGADAPGMLTPTQDGAPITLRITGSGLFRKREDRDRDEDGDIDADDWEINAVTRYTPKWLPGFLTHTYLTDKPAHRVLIDESIALNPITSGTFSDTELTMKLDPQATPDYQIGGIHTCTIVMGKNWVQIPIRFGPAHTTRSLSPSISTTRLIQIGTNQADWLVEVIGRNLPIGFVNTYASINGQRAYMHGVFATAGDSIGFIHVPGGAVSTSATNTLALATPFGITYGQF